MLNVLDFIEKKHLVTVHIYFQSSSKLKGSEISPDWHHAQPIRVECMWCRASWVQGYLLETLLNSEKNPRGFGLTRS